MKKIFLFAAAAALLTACSSEELSNQEVAQLNAETPVAFSIYTPRSVTRAGLPLEQTTATVGAADAGTPIVKHGFGVFAYYTNGGVYDGTTTPNFMYNQRVVGNGTGGANPTAWSYEPVKYWPNEYGNSATSDDIDRVTFFAYAPWVEVIPSTGIPAAGVSEDEKGITAITKNTATGDPIIKYVVDPEADKSVDLLWGVAAKATDETSDDPKKKYAYYTEWGAAKAQVNSYAPFIDLLKPNNPLAATDNGDNKIRFNLRHALSKLNVTIRYASNITTPGADGAGDVIDATETKVYVRSIKIGGFVMKGALNLNNGQTPKLYNGQSTWKGYKLPIPNWKAYDGLDDIEYKAVTFKDGRQDGYEGATDGADPDEEFLGLNPDIIEGFTDDAMTTKTDGVTKNAVNLFNSTTPERPIYVIPCDKDIDVEIVYDVETINPKLASFLSDGITHGLSVENKIYKKATDLFGTNGMRMEAGVAYTLNIVLGMTSVKVDASVTSWDPETIVTGDNAELPANQNP
jgi:hypothetical protein